MSQSRFGIFKSYVTSEPVVDGIRVVGAGLTTLLACSAFVYDISIQAVSGLEIPGTVVAFSLAAASLLLLTPTKPAEETRSERSRQISNGLYRGTHAAIATLVAVGYITDPKAAVIDYAPDFLIHLNEALLPDALNELALAAHVARSVQAGAAFWSGNSTVPRGLNFTDVVLNHSAAIYHRISNLRKQENAVNEEDSRQLVLAHRH